MVKHYKDLELVDNFMFCKVMSTHTDLCQHLVELILDSPIRQIRIIDSEKGMDIIPGAKGIRMDIYMDDEAGTVYDLEMQTTRSRDLAKRSRYYQGMLDLNLLEKGDRYRKLPKSVIIFICTFDHFGENLPVYLFENRCVQELDLRLEDETSKIFVNLSSKQITENPELKSVFEYFNHQIAEDEFTQKLENAVENARGNNRWEMEYMQWRAYEMDMEDDKEDAREDALKEGYAKGKIQMLCQLYLKKIISLETAVQESGMNEEQFLLEFEKYAESQKNVD